MNTAVTKFLAKFTRLALLMTLCMSLSACLGTVVGGVVDTAIEVVKVPFKVGAAAVDVITKDEFSGQSPRSQKLDAELGPTDNTADELANERSDEIIGIE